MDKHGYIRPDFIRYLQQLEQKTGPTLTQRGELESTAPIRGRTEGIGTTAQQLNNTGQLLDTDQIAADGTGSPLTGGRRGFLALDSNNRLANSFRANAVNVSEAPLAASDLSNDGAVTSIPIAANTKQFAAGQVSYNSGSVDPGAFGTFFIYADDPTFAGGAVTYVFTSNEEDQTAAEGRVLFGKITTTNGTPQTGGGNTGGSTPGGQGGKGYSTL